MKRNIDAALLLLRMILAVVFVAHGSQKLFGWFGGPGPQAFVGHLTSQGMPAAIPWLVIVAEFFGGIALLFGFLTRLAAAGIFLEMMGTVFVVHAKIGFFMNWGSVAGRGEGFEYSLTLAIACLAIALAGPGMYSIDAGLRR